MDGGESGTEEIVRHERQSVQEKQQPENDEAKRQRPQVGQSRICKGAVNKRKVIDEAVIRMTRFGRINEFTDGAIRNVGDLMKKITLRIRRNLLFFDQIT